MEQPSKLNERLTLIANLSVVVGIIFLAVELQQNTQPIQAQTRDSLTKKQMMMTSWVGTDLEVAGVLRRGVNLGVDELSEDERVMFVILVNGILREYENSHYSHQRFDLVQKQRLRI